MKKILFLFSILLFSIIAFGNDVQATTIFSPLLEMEIEPGQTQPGIVKVYNETDQNLYLTSSVESFKAGNETGQPIYIPLEQKDSFLQWFTIAEKAIILKPKQVGIIPFTVAVPEKALPGGYYAVIFWQTTPGPTEDKSAVSVASKVGTLIFLKVKGEVTEQGELLEFKTQPEKNYFFSLPINFLIRFKNLGNVHLKPVGEIKLTGCSGQTKVLPVNFQERNILPDSVRRFEIVWGQTLTGNWLEQFFPQLKQEIKELTFGKYTATLGLSYGVDNKQTISKKLNFWLFPYRLIIILLVAIFILLALFKINKKIKKIKQSGTKKL